MDNENESLFLTELNQINNEETFDLDLINGQIAKCKQLTTAQLKELIKTIVDSPLTQTRFISTVTEIISESVKVPDNYILTTIDKLLFLLELRIQSISSKMTLNNNGSLVAVDFQSIKQNLHQTIKNNNVLFESKEISEGKFSVSFGVSTLLAETQLNEEIYKFVIINADDEEEVSKILGEAFVNEIAKCVKTVKVNEKVMDLSTVNFSTRLKIIESLPAYLIQKVVEYIENYKRVIEECLTVEGVLIHIDGSLFSVR